MSTGQLGYDSTGTRKEKRRKEPANFDACYTYSTSCKVSTNAQVNTAKDRKVQFTIWHGARKHVACLRTIKSLVENMIIGVTKGFLYKMRLVYAHFPINAIPSDDGSHLQIRNFCMSVFARRRGLRLTISG
jgi:hypothetical protein